MIKLLVCAAMQVCNTAVGAVPYSSPPALVPREIWGDSKVAVYPCPCVH